jgi:hypothetical protein
VTGGAPADRSPVRTDQKKNMKTLKELIVAARCRKGTAAGIDESGEWWQAGGTIKTARSGGDGIGHSAPSVRCDLQMRHYRPGPVVVGVLVERWHQNVGTRTEWVPLPGIEESETAAEVVAFLLRWNGDGLTVLSDWCQSYLVEELGTFGLLASAPSPDEETA